MGNGPAAIMFVITSIIVAPVLAYSLSTGRREDGQRFLEKKIRFVILTILFIPIGLVSSVFVFLWQ